MAMNHDQQMKAGERALPPLAMESSEARSSEIRVSRRKLREERDGGSSRAFVHVNDGRPQQDKKKSAQRPFQRLKRAWEDTVVYLHQMRFLWKTATFHLAASNHLQRQIASRLSPSSGARKLQLVSSVIETGLGKQTDKILRHDVSVDGQSKTRSFVEKVIQPDYDRSILRPWAQEALVYMELTKEKQSFGLSVPSCHGIAVERFNRVNVFIDYLEEFHNPSSPAEWERVAYAIGEFGGWASLKRRWKASWLPRGADLRLRPAQALQAWENFGGASPGGREVQDNYRFLAERFDLAVQLYERLPSTICHSDPNPKNIFISCESPSVFLIDWERVSRGKITDDLILIYLPQNLLLHSGMDLEEYLALEEGMLANYIAGVTAHTKNVNGKEIEKAFLILNCFAMMRWLARGVQMRPSLQRLLAEFPERGESFRQYIVVQSHRAREALEAETNTERGPISFGIL